MTSQQINEDIGSETSLADEALFALVKNYCAEADGKIRAEHAMSTIGAVLGDLILRQLHPEAIDNDMLKPGQVFISDPVNVILSDNTTDPDEVSPLSVWGLTKTILEKIDVAEIMPAVAGLYENFAAGQPQRFGFVPLSVPEENQCWMMPLRAGYELRNAVDAMMIAHGLNDGEQRAACVLTAVRLVAAVMRVLEPIIAVRIFLETTWGMAKTVPMTESALAALNETT